MNAKGQAESIIIFFGLMIAVFIVSIIVLRMTNSIITPFATQISNISAPAGQAVTYAQTRFTSWWDYTILLIFAINVILLLVSAFLIDIHPAFVLIYIVAIIFMFIFGNYALSAVDAIWGGVGTATETAQTPITQFLINNFQMIMLGIVILSGIVCYAKFKLFPGQGTGGNY